MAKKPAAAASTANNKKPASSAGNHPLVRRIVREGALISAFLLGLLLLLALVSWSPTDPGFTTTGDGSRVENAIGHLGAWIADVLLHLFGYFAYLFPLALGFKVVSLYRGRGSEGRDLAPIVVTIRSIGVVLCAAGASALATIHFALPDAVPWPAGGLVGAALAELTMPALAILGSTLLYLAIFLFGLTIAFHISWLRVVDRTGEYTLQFFAWVAQQWRDWGDRRRDLRLAREQRQRERAAAPAAVRSAATPRIEPVISEPAARTVARKSSAPVAAASPATGAAKPAAASASTSAAGGSAQRSAPAAAKRSTGDNQLPALSLLDINVNADQQGYSEESLEAMSRLLEMKLADFGIEVEVTAVNPGPVITRFEVQPAPGVKASRITALGRDLARSLAVISVRVVEVIPGKTVIGIEIPNEKREMILLSQVLTSPEFDKAQSLLSMALGHDIVGKPVIVDLAKMPHLLVAGTTGSGKSVGVNAMILSLLYKASPEHVRLIMIDPKMLELSVYDGIPHLLTPVITDMKDAANGLRWSVAEMERRYKLMSALGVRNLAGFNKKVRDATAAGEPIIDPIWRPDPHQLQDDQQAPELQPLPHIVVIVDELADMMMVVGKKVEELIARIAQKARAAGIHLILATQRPSVDVLTGLIKANIPTRLSYMVQSKVDSRTILGEGGAEQLLGHGDMLFLPPGGGVARRVHGAFVSDEEVHRVVAELKSQGEPEYIDAITEGADERDMGMGGGGGGDGSLSDEGDELYDEAVAFVIESRKASISAVQRKLRIGYNRAARMIEAMESAGVVSPMGSNGQREVLVPGGRD